MRARSLGGIIVAVALAGAAQAQDANSPPEVKKTVDAFAGRWTLTGVDQEPGARPAAVTATMACKVAALGAAVDCQIDANVAGAGRIEAATVIGYSPDERVVRWMEISSTGEYHDHKGRWDGTRLQFEPLAFSIGGQSAVEDLALTFPSAARLTLRSATRTSGGVSLLDLTGVRTVGAVGHKNH